MHNMYIYFYQSYCSQISEISYMYYSTSLNFLVVTINTLKLHLFLVVNYFLLSMIFSGWHAIFWLSLHFLVVTCIISWFSWQFYLWHHFWYWQQKVIVTFSISFLGLDAETMFELSIFSFHLLVKCYLF